MSALTHPLSPGRAEGPDPGHPRLRSATQALAPPVSLPGRLTHSGVQSHSAVTSPGMASDSLLLCPALVLTTGGRQLALAGDPAVSPRNFHTGPWPRHATGTNHCLPQPGQLTLTKELGHLQVTTLPFYAGHRLLRSKPTQTQRTNQTHSICSQRGVRARSGARGDHAPVPHAGDLSWHRSAPPRSPTLWLLGLLTVAASSGPDLCHPVTHLEVRSSTTRHWAQPSAGGQGHLGSRGGE